MKYLCGSLFFYQLVPTQLFECLTNDINISISLHSKI